MLAKRRINRLRQNRKPQLRFGQTITAVVLMEHDNGSRQIDRRRLSVPTKATYTLIFRDDSSRDWHDLPHPPG